MMASSYFYVTKLSGSGVEKASAKDRKFGTFDSKIIMKLGAFSKQYPLSL